MNTLFLKTDTAVFELGIALESSIVWQKLNVDRELSTVFHSEIKKFLKIP